MMLDHHTITPAEMTDISNRLAPYLPPHLTRAERAASGWGMEYTFRPFTGREAEPIEPSTHQDPHLTYVPEDQDEREHSLRRKAGALLSDMYARALALWRDAAYVADLKDVVQDAPARWAEYEQASQALEAAAAYLRTPQAGAEWPSAIARLVDAQLAATTTATAFDQRARDIAQAHRTHVYADLGHHAALTAAGYPEARHWHITDLDGYGGWGDSSLAAQVHRLIEEQDDHLAKVGRLTGA
ncbi:hypothetical protein ACIQVA_37210 [Streptomyces microflavus]|uniref:hypothetical protein n=1 Tax=Streptomyces microflavus TaxID=1919 RepID=UPI0038052A60